MSNWVRTFGIFLASAIILLGCKTTRKRNNVGASSGSSGVFDDNNSIKLPVPSDLKGFSPPVGSKTNGSVDTKTLEQSRMQALGLTAPPVSSEGIEEIAYRCFSNDSNFIAEGWFFYAQLLSNGKVIKDFESQTVDRCNQMQLTLKTLDRNDTYVVKAMFFWQSEDKKTTIVWYEGETEPFKPRDQNRTLKLDKLKIDQQLNVEVEKGEKDKCIYQDYLWNGYRCLDSYSAVSFVHTDKSDYADPESRIRKCMTIGSSGFGMLSECDYSITQRVRPYLVKLQVVPNSFKTLDGELGWFELRFDSTQNEELTCLSARQKNGEHVVARERCRPAEEGESYRHHLWNLVPLAPGDDAARDSFKLVSQYNGEVLCMSVPAERSSISSGPSIRTGAPVKLTSCNSSDVNIVKSQPIQLWNAGE